MCVTQFVAVINLCMYLSEINTYTDDLLDCVRFHFTTKLVALFCISIFLCKKAVIHCWDTVCVGFVGFYLQLGVLRL